MNGRAPGHRRIPCQQPLAQYRSNAAVIDEAIRRTLDSGWYVLGREVEAFEREFADYCGTGEAIAVGSGTDALRLVLQASGIGPGDEVITVAHTALATIAAIVMSGATPVLVDVDPNTGLIDARRIEAAVTAQTRAVIPVHLYGQPADMEAVLSTSRRHGLPVIEDAAQAHGARIGDRRAGSLGLAGCFSFYPTKNLGAVGDGGAVVTDDHDLAGKLRMIRQYGWDAGRTARVPGVNSRLDEIQAAILRAKLPGLDADNERRRVLAERYNRALAGLPLSLPRVPDGVEPVWHLYVVATERRSELRSFLSDRGIDTAIHYPQPPHRHPGYADAVRIGPGGLPVTEELVERIVTLPLYPELEDAEADAVAAAVAAFFA